MTAYLRNLPIEERIRLVEDIWDGMVLRLVAVLVILACSVHPSQVQGQSEPAPMTNGDVINLFKGGLSKDLITKAINARPNRFDLSAEGLLDLKNNGIPDDIIEAMISRQSGASRPSDRASSSSEDDDSFYLYDGDKKIRLTKARTQIVTKAGFLSVFGAPAYGYATLPESGPAAATRVANKLPTFGELAVPLNLRVGEHVHLVRLQLDEGLRRIRLAKVSAFSGAQGFPEEARVPVAFEDIGETTLEGKPARLFRMKPTVALDPGEYAVLVSLKDFFDFGIDP